MTTVLLRRAAASFDSRDAARCIPMAAHSSASRRPATTRPRRRPSPTTDDGWYQDQVARFDATLPLERASTPPSSWYTRFHELERGAVFFNGWIAAAVAPVRGGDYATGEILGQPILLTRRLDGVLRGFFNVCTHAGSCLVGPWTGGERISPSLVGKSTRGVEHRKFKCPYHGWEFNLDGKLIKTTNVRGMQNFTARQFDLRPIRIQTLGPIAFLNFGDHDETKNAAFVKNCQLLSDRLTSSGYQGDLQDVELVETRFYTLKCNWKVRA
jgi:choline monooxygenase